MDYIAQCRTCLGSEKEMRHIHTIVRIAGDEVRLSDILQNFYNFKLFPEEESYPENICINCVHQLTITYSFKVLIESSARTLADSAQRIEPITDNCHYNYESDDVKQELQIILKETKHKVKAQTLPIENEVQIVYCVECKLEFPTTKALTEHCSNSHPVKSSVGRDCEYCNEKFEDFRSLVRHRKLHIRPYLCENCWEGFYEITDLNCHSCQPNMHSKDKNKSEKVLRQCDQCGKSYPPGYIRTHMLTHSNDRPYSCKYCPKRFKVPGGLHSHVLWNHKRTRNHKCEVCNATFISSSSRSSHIRKNHLKEKKYGCDSCGKRFFSKSELQRHKLTHTGVKNFHCHLCDKSYQTRYGLNVHLKSHSQMTMNVMNL